MQEFEIIYEENKKLDDIFENLYHFSDNPSLIVKNKLELLVEIGELANETKCFKYWSHKEINIDNVKEEYADCIIMALCFFNSFNISLNEKFSKIDRVIDIDKHFGELYLMSANFMEKENRDLIKKIFIKLLEIGYFYGLNNKDIIDSVLKKIQKNKQRFIDGF